MSEVREVRVRADELAPLVGDLPHNVALIEAAIRDAAENDVELLVLPELATSGYYLRDVEEARSVGLDRSDPLFERWAALLRPGMVLVVGFCETAGDGMYNSAAVLGAEGVLSVYRKTHLWDAERDIFTAGAERPAVVTTPVGSLGTLICYDLEFPEMPRGLALRGADILAVPTNWPLIPRPHGERAPEVIQAMAAARTSGLAIVCCDRTGDERGGRWTEGSTVISAEGWPVGVKSAARQVDATIELRADRWTVGPRNHLLRDRRPELYSD
jgi:predicted amidohydrolase